MFVLPGAAQLKEKEREHAEQLRESEAERLRLEKQLKRKVKPTATNAAARQQIEKKSVVIPFLLFVLAFTDHVGVLSMRAPIHVCMCTLGAGTRKSLNV